MRAPVRKTPFVVSSVAKKKKKGHAGAPGGGVHGPTCVDNIFEISKYHVDGRSPIRFLVPTHLSNLPNIWGKPWGFNAMRSRRPFPLQDQRVDVIRGRKFRKWELSGRELEQEK